MDRAEICRCNFTEPEKSRYNEIIYQDCAPLCANHAQHLAVSADKIDIVTIYFHSDTFLADFSIKPPWVCIA